MSATFTYRNADLAGRTVRARFRRTSDLFAWNAQSGAWEAMVDAHYAQYLTALTPVGTGGDFTGTVPAGIAANTELALLLVVDTVGGSPALGDEDAADERTLYYNGTDLLAGANVTHVNGTPANPGSLRAVTIVQRGISMTDAP